MPGRLLVALLAALAATGAVADEKLWSLLRQGGQVVLIRHTVTTPGAGDPPGMKLEECGTQRNLSDEGRRHAGRIGAAWRKRAIPVERVVSSPWCRCLETARLAFGEPEVSRALSNLFGRAQNRDAQVREIRSLIAAYRGKGNLVLVTHGSVVAPLTGLHPATGEMVILSRGEVAGRLSVD